MSEPVSPQSQTPHAFPDIDRARLVLLARQWVTSRDDAEDVVQDAVIRFWQRPATDTVRDPHAYLCLCVRNAAIDSLRASRRRSRLLTTSPQVDSLFECPLELEERRHLLEQSLLRLPVEQREVLTLRIWGELTFPQIAEVVGVNLSTIHSRFRYGLNALRISLGEQVSS